MLTTIDLTKKRRYKGKDGIGTRKKIYETLKLIKRQEEMENHRLEIIKIIENIVEARDIIFTQIVNLAMSGEMNDFENAFDIGETYSFTLSHFEDIEDINVQKLISLCKNAEKTIFSLMNLNGINENEITKTK